MPNRLRYILYRFYSSRPYRRCIDRRALAPVFSTCRRRAGNFRKKKREKQREGGGRDDADKGKMKETSEYTWRAEPFADQRLHLISRSCARARARAPNLSALPRFAPFFFSRRAPEMSPVPGTHPAGTHTGGPTNKKDRIVIVSSRVHDQLARRLPCMSISDDS